MKKKDKEALKNLSMDELKAELRQITDKRFRLQFKRSSSPLTNPMELRLLRRKAAMLETWIRERGHAAAAEAK